LENVRRRIDGIDLRGWHGGRRVLLAQVDVVVDDLQRQPLDCDLDVSPRLPITI